MQEDMEDFVASCLTRQQTKFINSVPVSFLQPLSIPTTVGDKLTMDFIIGLPPSHGYIIMMVVVDRVTK